MDYQAGEIEPKWRKYWEDNATYRVENQSVKPKYYILDMFPYPSGAGLHVGHPLGYIASDIFARYKRMKGFNVLHPMGYDAFGLPAEQYAIESGVHPQISTKKNIETYRRQFDLLGLSYDWSREVQTCNPDFYRWTQWLFCRMYEHFYHTGLQKACPITDLEAYFATNGSFGVPAHGGLEHSFSAADWAGFTPKQQQDALMQFRLAFRNEGSVNWCEALGTVLSNDEVENGVSERGGHPVEIKPMNMWRLRTTAYAERLINGLDTVDFSEPIKAMQRNWIGRSVGAQVIFEVDSHPVLLEIYTTRPDTIFGATFMVLAPDHDLVAEITTPQQKAVVEAYVDLTKTRSERQRIAEVRDVSGAFTGAYAVHPLTSEPLPIYISEYVLKGYGTGAIMAVPADDERDRRFAEKFGLKIVDVVDRSDFPNAEMGDKVGKMINSDFLNGMDVLPAIQAMCDKLESLEIGSSRINYRLRDATFSRQRYWGEPIPAIFNPDGTTEILKDSELPLLLPHVNSFNSVEGKGPLRGLTDWAFLPDGSERETDTMPGFAGSSWYYLRYMDPNNADAPVGKEAYDYWQDVDFYIGGAEHAVGHLIYSRTYHKFLKDIGLVSTEEPYKRLFNQGMIQGIVEQVGYHTTGRYFVSADIIPEDSKDFSYFNIHVDFVSDYGDLKRSHMTTEGIEQYKAWRPEYADARFEMSTTEPDKFFTISEVGKMSKSKFNVINPDDMVERYGADCFRMYEMFLGPIEQSKPWNTNGITGVAGFLRKFWGLFFDQNGEWQPGIAVPEKDAQRAVHACVKKVSEDIERFSHNTCVSAFMVCVNDLRKSGGYDAALLGKLVRCIAPLAPHMADELWSRLGHTESVHLADWPTFNEAFLVSDTVIYPVCVNGKRRTEMEVVADTPHAELEKMALALAEKWLEGQQPKKVIVVPGRMVNLVM
jgi:leucyl-tRNA synthetase